ncbi:MAG: SMP-30/gluconolactonase/LRE family protein [Chitinophagaceae bacterium]|nr:SMP-30/gluconolactonase/LRE family protein [Chitinophagaceae bacterium]
MYQQTGALIRYDESLDSLIAPDAKADIIATGYEWSEGPLWIEAQQMLLFSDVPTNTIYKWTEKEGTSVYLQPSGYTGTTPSVCNEPGSNGLTLDLTGKLVLCQHGDRQMGRMDAPLDQPKAVYTVLATHYEGKRFSSPNDCVFSAEGELFFTDPPYGLKTQDDSDSLKEIPFNGVYRVKKNGEVDLVINNITRPNGLAFFPGSSKLLVACSDPDQPDWHLIDIVSDSMIAVSLFYSAKEERKSMKTGLPDGLKINQQGIVFASGPGGVYIFNKEGKKLGLLKLEAPASNCALSADEKTLYITNDMQVLRVKLK